MCNFLIFLKRLGILLIITFLSLLLFGCKTSEEKLFDVCISKLEKELGEWATYDGWSLENATARLYKMEPDIETNTRHNTDIFWNFEVIISGFTVKNGFNADVKSLSLCTGYVSKNAKGEYEPPSELLIDLTLNGKPLGLLGLLSD